MRSGPWKLYVPLSRRRPRAGLVVDAKDPARLYDVAKNPGETNDLVAKHSEVVRRLTNLAEAAREELGDLNRPDSGQRPAGWVADPQPVRLSR